MRFTTHNLRRSRLIKKQSVVLCLALGFSVSNMASLAEEKKPDLNTETDKLSYSFGYNIGINLGSKALELNNEALLKGIKDGADKSEPLMTAAEMRESISTFQQETLKKRAEKHAEAAKKNQEKGEAYLKANAQKEGVVTLPSGLQYKVIEKVEKGQSPKATDTVKVHYRGTLIDGTEFDSSYARKAPATFAVNRVIKGWTEALQLMKTGEKWQLTIPYDIAYGERGNPPKIGPKSALLFDVELLEIVSTKE